MNLQNISKQKKIEMLQSLSPQLSDKQLQGFMRIYELKKLTYQQIYSLYTRNALSPAFRTTMYSAIILILCPSLTNVYYMFRPNSMFARVMPFIVPVVCVAQYMAAFRYDLQNFCFMEGDDSAKLRRKYEIIVNLQVPDNSLKKIGEQISYFQKNKLKENKQVKKQLVTPIKDKLV